MVSKRQKLSPKDRFFARQKEALTFDDVRLRTAYSEVLPSQANLETLFSRNVPLKVPIVSAAMDTVTEEKMAIALAEQGGLGIIHKLMTPDKQVKQVMKVKSRVNGIIRTPTFFYDDQSVLEILKESEKEEYQFRSFPILNRDGRLVGIITATDFDFCRDKTALASQIMTPSRKLITGKVNIEPEEAFAIMAKKKTRALPLVDSQGKLAGMYVIHDVNRVLSEDPHPFNTDENGQLRVGAAVGVYDFERVDKLVRAGVDVIVIDTAHGNSKGVVETVKEIKKQFKVDVVAGNVSEADGVRRLARAGADGVKTGQGGGSICTTRIVSGVGTPQVTAVHECTKEAEKYNLPSCSDGGIRNPGDVAIAIAAGAYCVMLGNVLAGTDESPGEVIYTDKGPRKSYRGMGSLGAMKDSKAAAERYGQGETPTDKLVPEGVEGKVVYRGSLEKNLVQFLGGLRAGMGYTGSRTIEEFRKNANFRRITNAGLKESHPHDLASMEKAPNYERE